MLYVICYMLYVICICYMLYVICYMLYVYVICYMLYVICYMLYVICCLLVRREESTCDPLLLFCTQQGDSYMQM